MTGTPMTPADTLMILGAASLVAATAVAWATAALHPAPVRARRCPVGPR